MCARVVCVCMQYVLKRALRLKLWLATSTGEVPLVNERISLKFVRDLGLFKQAMKQVVSTECFDLHISFLWTSTFVNPLLCGTP